MIPQMKTISEQSPEWFSARIGIPTCSVLSDVLSNGKKAGTVGAAFMTLARIKACERLSGSPDVKGISFAMQRGSELEPMALQAYADATGATLTKPGFVFHATLKFGGSPDAITSDGICVEVKCPNSWDQWSKARKGDIGDYLDQVQGQLCVTGLSRCDLVIFDDRMPPDLALTIHQVFRDESAISRIEQRVAEFNRAVDAEVDALQRGVTK